MKSALGKIFQLSEDKALGFYIIHLLFSALSWTANFKPFTIHLFPCQRGKARRKISNESI